jgi:hypothetical protein
MADKIRQSSERPFLRAFALDQQKNGQGRISLAAGTRGEAQKKVILDFRLSVFD